MQGDLVTEKVRNDLWKKGQRKNALLVGFLKSLPNNLPVKYSEHKELAVIKEKLSSLKDNVFSKIILGLLSKEGQAYLSTVEAVMKKPSNQDVVISLFDTVKNYFKSVCPNQTEYQDIEVLLTDANKYVDVTATQFDDLKVFLEKHPELSGMVKSIIILSLINESLLNPVFSRTDAIGSLMRKKIDHIISPLANEISILKNMA